MIWVGKRGQLGAERRAGGFSLVEVVSSLGIISFGLIALLGLLPVGMRTARDARESTAESQLRQYLSNLARQTPPSHWTDIAEPRVFYFDRQGLNVSADSPDVFYRASLAVESNSGTVLPSDAGYVSSALSTVHVKWRKCRTAEAEPEKTVALHLVAAGR